MDKKQLKEDLANLTLTEVCEKYELSLGDLFKLSGDLYTYKQSESSFIRKTKSNVWSVNKYINGENIYFGVYSTREDAIRVRDELIKCEWDKNQLEEICNRLNIVPRK